MPQLCAVVGARSGRQLLGVARRGLHDLGADLTAGRVNSRDSIARLFVAYAPSARPLLPIGAVRIAFDLPLAMHDGPARRLKERRTILGPIDNALAGLPAGRRRGGVQIHCLAREERLDFGSRHVGSERRTKEADDAGRNGDSMDSNTHSLVSP